MTTATIKFGPNEYDIDVTLDGYVNISPRKIELASKKLTTAFREALANYRHEADQAEQREQTKARILLSIADKEKQAQIIKQEAIEREKQERITLAALKAKYESKK
jgi:hypothetical protein